MGRPLSWLDRLVFISRTVAASSRSHYDRKDLQELFELQARSAQNLMAAMPVVSIGSAHLVAREALSDFLRRMTESESPAAAYTALRAKPPKPVRRKLRTLSLQSGEAGIDTPPTNITLARGEMSVRFRTMEELAEAMVYLATVLQENLDAFAALYEPPSEESNEQE